MVPEVLDCRVGRGQSPEGLEEEIHRVADALVGIADHPVRGVVDQSHRQGHLQLPAPSLVQDATLEPGPEHVQFRLAHGPLETQQQAIVEVARIIDSVFVQDEGLAQGTDLEQTVPFGGVAGQTGDLETEHDPRSSDPHIGHQALEARTIRGARRRLSEILIDHDDPLQRPAERHRALA